MEAISVKNFGYVHMISYADLNFNDQIYLLKMRNDTSVRKWMFSQKVITENEHLEFIGKLNKRTDVYYFLVKSKNIILGCVNFSDIVVGECVRFGIFANPFGKIKGTGRVLEAAGMHYAQKMWDTRKIILEVFSNNLRAINFYKKCGFKIVGSYRKQNLEVTQMEKLREFSADGS